MDCDYHLPLKLMGSSSENLHRFLKLSLHLADFHHLPEDALLVEIHEQWLGQGQKVLLLDQVQLTWAFEMEWGQW